MNNSLHIKDIPLLKTLDEDGANRWTVTDIANLFNTAQSFERSLHVLQHWGFLLAWQARGHDRRLRPTFTFNPAKRAQARRTVAGADQVALAEQLAVLGRPVAALAR